VVSGSREANGPVEDDEAEGSEKGGEGHLDVGEGSGVELRGHSRGPNKRPISEEEIITSFQPHQAD